MEVLSCPTIIEGTDYQKRGEENPWTITRSEI
jgi:hypothetical protein